MTIHRERVTAVAGGPMRGRLMPMIEISTATDRDYAVRLAALKAGAPDTPDFSGDCSDLSTFIWYWSHAGRGHAKRIAGDLERDGTAVVYPFEHVVIVAGRRHRLIEVGMAVHAIGGTDDE